MKINLFWDFGEAVANIRALKQEYYRVLASFSIYEIKEEVKYKQELRSKLYELDIFEWQKDKLWEYMNDDITFGMLLMLGNRQK